jgi:arylsulfatase A-like enzyme
MRPCLLFAALLFSEAVFSTRATAELQERPNILWLVSEDNNPFLGAYGDTLANSPTLDKLAEEGVLFERCFAQPVCAPSRFALITGMHSVSCGPAEHMRAQGKIPAWLHGFPSLLRAAGYFATNNAKTDYNSPIDPAQTWDESGKSAHYLRRPDPKQPFFSVFNDETTHESCLFPAESPVDGFEPTPPHKVRIPPYQPDTPEIRADWARYYDRIRLMDSHVAEKLEQLEKSGLAADTIVFYYGDNGGVLPRSKRFLQKSGTHVPLIVYFPPKWRHLAPAAPGSRISDPVSFVDFGATVLSLAGVKIPDYIQGRAFAGLAKGEPNEFVYCTRDRMDERYDMIRSVMDKRWLYIRNYRPDLNYVQPLAYMFRARGYQSWARVAREGKLTTETAMFWGEKPAEELYDMSSDPDNVRNLVSVEACRTTLERMRAALLSHTLAVVDNGFIPEGSALEGYDASRRPGAYPLERVVELANLASERNPIHLPRFIAALEDNNEAMRWWAAQGCAMLRERATPAQPSLLKHLGDASWPVRLTSADALARLGQWDVARPIFEEGLAQTGVGAVVLQTANILAQLGEAARPVLPAMKAAIGTDPSERQTEGHRAEQYAKRYPQDLLTHTIDELEGRVQRLSYPSCSDQK